MNTVSTSTKMMGRYQDSDSNDMITTDLITSAKALKSLKRNEEDESASTAE